MPPARPRGQQEAHPHSRGENTGRVTFHVILTGSSPLTRGKREFHGAGARDGGLIPTHAGKTTVHTTARQACRAHPHSRGENLVDRVCFGFETGSSPLTRGKLMLTTHNQPSNRLIPTHAGKTIHMLRCLATTQAHPHSRGENEARGVAWHPSEGSSPLTRGKRGTHRTAR